MLKAEGGFIGVKTLIHSFFNFLYPVGVFEKDEIIDGEIHDMLQGTYHDYEHFMDGWFYNNLALNCAKKNMTILYIMYYNNNDGVSEIEFPLNGNIEDLITRRIDQHNIDTEEYTLLKKLGYNIAYPNFTVEKKMLQKNINDKEAWQYIDHKINIFKETIQSAIKGLEIHFQDLIFTHIPEKKQNEFDTKIKEMDANFKQRLKALNQ